jgi:hypothetical protein
VKVQLARWGDGADGREMIPGPPLVHDGGGADGRRRADDTGQGIEPRFVDEEEALALDLRPLVRAGQVSSLPRLMAASSRWRARRAGLCGRQWIAWHRRPTWRGWYETPNSSWMMAAIRPRVQSGPRKPYASGPRCNNAGNWASCPAESRCGAPGGGRGQRASGPPSRPRFIHWLTAPALTPIASAIWRWDQPFCLRRQACNRRASFQLVGEWVMHGSRPQKPPGLSI